MRCPKCSKPLTTRLMSDGWLIETCPDCFGEFLARGQFARIDAAFAEPRASAAERRNKPP